MVRILITGVRGKTGAPLAGLLARHDDVEVLGGSSDVARVDLPGVRPVAFSWSDPATWEPAVRDVDAVFLVRPDIPEAPELIAELAALTPERTHLVLLSEQDVAWFPEDGWSRRAEQAVRESGRSWTMVRPSWFMDVFIDPRFFLDELARHGRLRYASGGQRVAWIDARDIAATAERALLDPRHRGEALEITGPAALTLAETAATLAEGVGREVTHVEESVADAVEGLEGFERWETEVTFQRVADGSYATVTDVVERVTGRPPRSLRQFATDHAAVWSRAAASGAGPS